MVNNLKNKLFEHGYLKVKNVLNFQRDLKPILNDMEFVMDCLIQKFAKKKDVKKVLNLDFKKKYSYISKLKIDDLDQYFNTRLPRDHVKKDSDYFATQSLWNLITNKNILDVVEKILGKEIMSNPVQNTRIKQPEKKLPKGSILDGLSGRTPWHQDAAVLNTKGQKLTDMVTVWIPFTKTTKKNGCMITVKKINKMGLLNHIAGYRGQVEIKDSKLLDEMQHIHLEADVGDVILLHKHSIHCSLPNRSNDFRISADLRYNVAGQPSGRDPLPNFYVRSKNKKNLKIQNFKQWLALWEKAKEKCIPRKYAFKYPLPTFKTNKRDLSKLI
ncbi:phytanoyl-CoA dioxygenase family protein [Candidatus Pelagibacter sp. HIMB123]|uniref:phytanoyl-CoA dioxygenase family protein n=1 Tax=Candidatus Pelagibacter sp. HIMB123 TaxID=3415413 RepID=UPI003F86065B